MSEAVHVEERDWLAHVPVTLFTIVMGLCGFTLALRAGEAALGFGYFISGAAHGFTMVIFAIVALLYLAKGLRHPGAVVASKPSTSPNRPTSKVRTMPSGSQTAAARVVASTQTA